MNGHISGNPFRRHGFEITYGQRPPPLSAGGNAHLPPASNKEDRDPSYAGHPITYGQRPPPLAAPVTMEYQGLYQIPSAPASHKFPTSSGMF